MVAILLALSTIAIPTLLSMKRTANEAAAKSNVRVLSSAAETSVISLGHYPTSLNELREYLGSADSFCVDLGGARTQFQGYSYGCLSDASGYTFEAVPVALGTTGSVTYTATTGGIITP